jgi:precorrin-6B methylase 2
VPTGLRIAVENKESRVEAIRENAKYNSFNEALARGKALARLDIDLTLGPDLSA